MALHWLSFCDPDRPSGDKFLGVAIVEAPEFLPAVLGARVLGCNPRGEVAGFEFPPFLRVPDEYIGWLLNTTEIAELELRMSS